MIDDFVRCIVCFVVVGLIVSLSYSTWGLGLAPSRSLLRPRRGTEYTVGRKSCKSADSRKDKLSAAPKKVVLLHSQERASAIFRTLTNNSCAPERQTNKSVRYRM